MTTSNVKEFVDAYNTAKLEGPAFISTKNGFFRADRLECADDENATFVYMIIGENSVAAGGINTRERIWFINDDFEVVELIRK